MPILGQPPSHPCLEVFLFFFGHLFFQHDFQDGFVGLDHAVVAESTHILNSFLRGVADDSIGVLNIYAMQ